MRSGHVGPIVGLLGVIGVATTGAAHARAPQTISSDRGGDIAVELPLDAQRLDRVLWRVAANTNSQLGIELAPEQPLRPDEMRRVPPVERKVSLRGRTAADAIAAIVDFAPGYEWSRAGQIINVAPRRTSRAGDFLDTELPAFTAKNVTVLEVLAQYRRVFDLTAPTSVAGAFMSTLSAPNEDTTERQRIVAESLARRFSVDRSNGTARDVLNAICQAHGSLSWKVQHIDGMADFSHSRVAFVTADGSRVHD